MTSRVRSSGFTLLEILVTLVVLGLLIAGLGQGTRFGMQALQIQSRTVHQRDDLDAVDRTVRNLVARMDPGSAIRDSTLRGTAARVAFTTDLPEQRPASIPRRADVLLLVDAAHRMVLRWTPHQHVVEFGASPPAQDAALLEGVDRIEFAYWPNGGYAWQATWAGRQLPALIRLRIVFAAGSNRHWPDIVAATTLDPRGV